MLANR